MLDMIKRKNKIIAIQINNLHTHYYFGAKKQIYLNHNLNKQNPLTMYKVYLQYRAVCLT
jgi:hypothetical protein